MRKNGIPKDWVNVRLGEISKIIYGKGLPTKLLKPDGFPVYGANGIIGFFEHFMYEEAQLLISCRGANSGRINISPTKCFVTNNSLIVDFPIEKETLRKTYYYFLQIANKERLVTGTAQPQVTINNAVEIELPLPPLPEQHRIVSKLEELFSELDEGIESFKTARQQLKVYRQAVLKHAFEGKLTEEWRKQHADELEPAETLLEKIKAERKQRYQQQMDEWEEAVKVWETGGKEGGKPTKPGKPKELPPLSERELAELQELPEMWAWVPLTKLSENIQIGPFGSLLHKADYVSNGTPLVNPSHIKNQKIKPDMNFTVSQKK